MDKTKTKQIYKKQGFGLVNNNNNNIVFNKTFFETKSSRVVN